MNQNLKQESKTETYNFYQPVNAISANSTANTRESDAISQNRFNNQVRININEDAFVDEEVKKISIIKGKSNF